MKTFKITLSAIVLSLLLPLIHSCNKYPDGPKFTILTKKERMQGQWDLKETDHSDGTVTYDSSNEIIELTEDFEYFYTSGILTISGDWEFASDKEKVTFKIGNVSLTYKIMRLKSKELWLQDETTLDVMKYKNTEKDN
ncbi:hypothetical protein [Fluviicola taffensis]|uniref:hypothetical protein n=1 Tax=Fluviicola taffensis TaxID=191579 RepID=UPI0031382D12